MLPSAQRAISAIALVVSPFMPRSLLSCSAAAKMWARVPLTASSVAMRGHLTFVIPYVAADEQRGDHRSEDQEPDRHEQADVDGVHEGALHGLREGGPVGADLGV